MNDKYILVADIGTQSLRISIVNNVGEIVAIKHEKYKEVYFSPKIGYAEQDPNFYYDELCKATKELAEENPELIKKCKTFTLTMFRDSAALLDENYNVVRPTILWLDQRNAKLKKNLKWYNTLIFWFVGMLDTVKYNRKRTAANWLQENEPENWKKIKYYVPLTAFLTYKLVGKLIDSTANCTGHYPIDFKKGKWLPLWHPKTEVFGIRQDQLCKIYKPGEVLGTITKKCSQESGIPEGITMYACGTDKSCETFGNGCLSPRTVTVSYGTACTIDVPTKKYGEPEKFLPGYIGCYPDIYNREVQIYRGYWMLTWFIKNFATDEISEAKEKEISVEDVFDYKIKDIEPGSNGLILQPYWGPGLKRPLARGAIIGFSDCHTKYHLYRAVVEGICFALKEGLESIQKHCSKKIDYLVVSGGGATNDVICQITADIFNMNVRRVQTTETATLGAAMAGFMFEGVFGTPEEAKEKMVRYVKEYKPNVDAVKKYDYLYSKVYRNIYPKLNNMYAELKEYSANEIL